MDRRSIMVSTELVIGDHKLDTEFFTGYVQHSTFRSDASRGRRRVKVVKKWYRDRELGRGSFGTVFLEKSEKEEYRAVKEIAKDKNSTVKIDYRRELMAMASLAKHDALFVQLLGWYENNNYVHIAMEYISHGHLRNYLEVERSESETKAVTRQLLEGLVVIHQEGFAHRDLKPENIFVVSESPAWVKIGDFGLAKLVRDGTAFRTQAFSPGYSAPEMGIKTSGDSSEYTNAVDIWAIGCITHEMLTQVLPFPNISKLSLYCTQPEFPRNSMLLKNISRKGMDIVESMLAFHPERRITAKEALASEWLRLEEEGWEGMERKDSAGPALPKVPASISRAEIANGDSLLANSKSGFHNLVHIITTVENRRTAELLLRVLRYRLQMGFLSEDPFDEMSEMAKRFDTLESLGRTGGETLRVGRQAEIPSVSLADVVALVQTTGVKGVLGAIIELPSVPCDEENQFRKRSTDLLQKWNEPIDPRDKNLARTSSGPPLKRKPGARTSPYPLFPPRLPSPERGGRRTRKGSPAHMNAKDAEEHVGAVAISRRQAKSFAVNEPWTHARVSVGGQTQEASASRDPNAFSNPKPYGNVDPYVERILESALEMRKRTNSPHESVLSDNAVRTLPSEVMGAAIQGSTWDRMVSSIS